MNINLIDRELEKRVDRRYKANWSSEIERAGNPWFGVKTPDVRKIAKRSFKQLKNSKKQEVFKRCEELLKKNYIEHKTIAFSWAFELKDEYTPSDFNVFERWVKKYIHNWGDCDDFCTHALGEFLVQYPQFLPKVFLWSKSKSWPQRRVAAVALIYPVRRGLYLNQVFRTADALLEDSEDLVRKGYGWMLKEASCKFQSKVFAYVMKNKSRMPRVALRYSIEKMSPRNKKAAMK